MTDNRIKGALYGFAIGDAMGATTEFMTDRDIFKTYGVVDEIIGGGWLELEPGEVTDDTQMMLCVAKASLEPEKNFLKVCCSLFTEWLRGGPKDVGNTCRGAILEGQGRSPEEWELLSLKRQAQRKKLDLGNGAVMRALYPVLLGKPWLAQAQGRLTHNNIEADYWLIKWTQAVDQAFRFHTIGETHGLFLMAPTGHVHNSVNNALYWAYNGDSFHESIIRAVNHGGDADTIAALTGGIAGAYWGYSNIPTKWIEQLKPSVRRELDWYAKKVKENLD
jgi:ADP-ribosyl-[dinitrogen reductase] hydrolase